jgi:hypothetical protein
MLKGLGMGALGWQCEIGLKRRMFWCFSLGAARPQVSSPIPYRIATTFLSPSEWLETLLWAGWLGKALDSRNARPPGRGERFLLKTEGASDNLQTHRRDSHLLPQIGSEEHWHPDPFASKTVEESNWRTGYCKFTGTCPFLDHQAKELVLTCHSTVWSSRGKPSPHRKPSLLLPYFSILNK